ncbi:MAG: CBS domain-containing protein [Anaerolineae bacterium]|nr:CBS domain-containing protein [Anaerolineae bacterium]
MHVILTHTNADFDAIASMLAAARLFPGAVPVLPQRVNRNVSEFLTLYRSGLPFITRQDLRPRQRITRLTITDTQSFDALKGTQAGAPVHIIEHHRPERPPAAHETLDYHELGAITTWLVEQLEAQRLPLTTLEATLLALGIYEDTGMLTYSGTTPRDVRAAAWLLEQGAVLDTVRRFLSHPLNDAQQALFEALLAGSENFTVQGYTITLCTATAAGDIGGVNAVTAHLRDVLDATALFVLVATPELVQLVARSTADAVDVGAVAALFGGGGHVRAAAAAISGPTLDEVRAAIRARLYEQVQPAVRVVDLMSRHPRTVNATDSLKDLIPLLRRIGHEGYPVLEDGRVIGLLTLRDADRALEHGLGRATAREVMQGGIHTLTPAASVPALEQLMVSSGWGQIPVVDDAGALLGIVTRTDLLKHWARTHPATAPQPPIIAPAALSRHLGAAATGLIDLIAAQAQQEDRVLYLVGGVVRDVLLERGSSDLDFVVESDAIAFAGRLVARYGGRLHTHPPFGTARWHLAGAALPGVPPQPPEHVDFVTARNEFYAHPTALPTVYSASVRLDLARRDFTMNTLALQLSPAGAAGRILDIFGGMQDIEQRLIRVLHSLSFVDDPTRILRAVRFAERLQFVIEPRTTELIQSALPLLRRITGERLRHELTLILQEAAPERALLKLEAAGVLAAIHPALRFVPPLDAALRDGRRAGPPPGVPPTEALWFVWLAHLDEVTDIAERLLFGAGKVRLFRDGARLWQERALLTDERLRPSHQIARLEQCDPDALRLIPLVLTPAEHTALAALLERARTLRPATTGDTLKNLGVPPGRAYKTILEALRAAWLDGTVTDAAAETALLQTLLRQYS